MGDRAARNEALSRREKSTKYVLSAAAFFSMAFAIPAGAYPGPAKIIVYKAAGMKATGKAVRGSCWTNSFASPRSNAFRCAAGNFIMDPCFSVSSKLVNCPRDIVANTGTVIDLTKPLPQGSSATRKFWPLGFRITGGSGIVCIANGTGITLSENAGPDYQYMCFHSSLVCTVPKASGRMAGAYFAICGISSSTSRIVKDQRTLPVVTIWE